MRPALRAPASPVGHMLCGWGGVVVVVVVGAVVVVVVAAVVVVVGRGLAGQFALAACGVNARASDAASRDLITWPSSVGGRRRRGDEVTSAFLACHGAVKRRDKRP